MEAIGGAVVVLAGLLALLQLLPLAPAPRSRAGAMTSRLRKPAGGPAVIPAGLCSAAIYAQVKYVRRGR